MLRPILLAAAALLLASAALPPATAQAFGQTTTEVRLGSLEAPAHPGGQVTIPGTVRYTYSFPGQLATVGTPVSLSVVEAPEWVTAVVSPSEMVVPVSGMQAATLIIKEVAFEVQVHFHESAPLGQSAVLKIEAVSGSNPPLKPSSGSSTTLLTTASDASCDAGNYSVQEFSAVPAGAGLSPVQAAAALGIAVTGSAAGFLMGRRRGAA